MWIDAERFRAAACGERNAANAVAGLRWGEAAARAVLTDCNIHARQPDPRQKRFRIKGGRGDGALRIGDLLIASKVPSGIRFSEVARMTPKSFHRGGFSRNLLTSKGCIIIG